MLLCLLLWVVVTMLSEEKRLAVYRKGFDPAAGGVLAGLRAVEAAVRADQQVELERAIQIAQEANDDCRIWAAKLAAAQEIIAKAKSWNDHDTGEPTYWDLHHILTQSPADALQAHDRQVAAKALTDAATAAQQGFVDEQNGIGFARVRTDWLTARAAAIVSAPSTAEQEGQR